MGKRHSRHTIETHEGGPRRHWQEVQMEELRERFCRRPEPVRGKTPGQEAYLQAILRSVVTLCLGPAGTGKTYIPVGLAAGWLHERTIEKVILTRPLVTCSGKKGQGVGFLKGDLMEKVSPYMRPMLDVLAKFFSPSEMEKMILTGVIELVPLDLMRGMSIENAVIVADEMQNAEEEQLRMLLTRFGSGTKVIVSGDDSQSDLYLGTQNPLVNAFHRLKGASADISVTRLTQADQARHPLINLIDNRLSAPAIPTTTSRYLQVGKDSWYAVKCPCCGKDSWYSNGDEENQHVADVEQVLCWSCGSWMAIPEDGSEPSTASAEPLPVHGSAGCPRPPRS